MSLDFWHRRMAYHEAGHVVRMRAANGQRVVLHSLPFACLSKT
jgi:hypothetical protein